MISKLFMGRRGPIIWMLSLMLIGIASMIPFKLPGSQLDKLLHFLAYFTLSALAFRIWPTGFRPWLAVGSLFMFGVGIELAQLRIDGRSASWLDLASNTLGMGTALLFSFRSRGSPAQRLDPRCGPPAKAAADPRA